MYPPEDWLDPSEYPDEADIDAFGDDSPPDDDPLTIGYVDGMAQPFWTGRRILLAVGALILIVALLGPALLR